MKFHFNYIDCLYCDCAYSMSINAIVNLQLKVNMQVKTKLKIRKKNLNSEDEKDETFRKHKKLKP